MHQCKWGVTEWAGERRRYRSRQEADWKGEDRSRNSWEFEAFFFSLTRHVERRGTGSAPFPESFRNDAQLSNLIQCDQEDKKRKALVSDKRTKCLLLSPLQTLILLFESKQKVMSCSHTDCVQCRSAGFLINHVDLEDTQPTQANMKYVKGGTIEQSLSRTKYLL